MNKAKPPKPQTSETGDIFFTCVNINFENKKSNEHLISLRDYDFVGEDQRLSSLLSERMVALQAPLNLTEERGAARGPPETWPRPHLQLKPDYLHSNVRLPQVVNVSLDYAELFNVSEMIHELNASEVVAVSGPGGAPAPGQGAASPSRLSDASAFELGAQRVVGRRIGKPYQDPSHSNYNKKILDIMKQTIYSTQLKILEIDPIIKKYQADPRFRMAYIYNRLDEWKHDMRTAYYALVRYQWWPRRVKRVIWYYEHILRMNIDITYSIEHLIYLHTEYMVKLEELAPLAQRKELWALKKKQAKLEKMEEMGITLPRVLTQKK